MKSHQNRFHLAAVHSQPPIEYHPPISTVQNCRIGLYVQQVNRRSHKTRHSLDPICSRHHHKTCHRNSSITYLCQLQQDAWYKSCSQPPGTIARASYHRSCKELKEVFQRVASLQHGLSMSAELHLITTNSARLLPADLHDSVNRPSAYATGLIC